MITADHQNKPEVANTKAQEMYDRKSADIILDVPTSSAALAAAAHLGMETHHVDLNAPTPPPTTPG